MLKLDIKNVLALGLLAGLCVQPVYAQAGPDRSLLLRVASLERIPVNGAVEILQREALIFRDGFVIATFKDADESCSILRGTASNQAMASLLRILGENRIGAQTGNCFLPELITGAIGGQHVLTWFGRGTRQHTFEVGDQFQNACPLSTLTIIDFLRGFLGNQRLAPSSSVVNTTCQQPAAGRATKSMHG